MHELVGTGIYSYSEAALLTGLKQRRVRRWFGADGRDPVFREAFQSKKGRSAIDFLDLIDVLIAGKLRDEGVSFDVLHKVYKNLRDKFNTPHAFCFRDIWTDGRTVFLKHLAESGDEKLVDMEHRQHVLTAVIQPYLDQIVHDPDTLLAQKWNIWDGVIVDPLMNFGWPTIAGTGLSTLMLASEYEANGQDESKVSSIFEVPSEAVLRAVDFQRFVKSSPPQRKHRAA